MKYLFTSESVTKGHPDKVCDQISDAILDAVMREDKKARVACETAITNGIVHVMGEITSKTKVNYEQIIRSTIQNIGYQSEESGFDPNNCSVMVTIHQQSQDIAMGVNNSLEYRKSKDYLDEIGAGDQGMMFGYACNESDELLPLSLVLSRKITNCLTELRENGVLMYLYPDGKSQVTVDYENNKVVRIDTIIISAQHNSIVKIEDLRKDLKELIIDKVIPSNLIDNSTKILINPTGRFVIGGPKGDSGVTGRKIIVDTYGGACPHGGGAFSGKDPTKVDRSGAYLARYIAKNIVAAKLADKCEIQIAYAIGQADIISLNINTFNTCKVTNEDLLCAVRKVFDFRPKAIIEQFNLLDFNYTQTAQNGHFGFDDYPWEKTDKAEILLKEISASNQRS